MFLIVFVVVAVARRGIRSLSSFPGEIFPEKRQDHVNQTMEGDFRMFEELVKLHQVRNAREFFAPDNEVLEDVYDQLKTDHETFKHSKALEHIITNHRWDVVKKRHDYVPGKKIGNTKITNGDVIQSPTSPGLRFISIEGLILDDIDYRVLMEESMAKFSSTAKGTEFENLPYDVFVLMVENGKLQGRDLIGLCVSNSKINQKCNHRDQEIFKRLLKKDFGVDYGKGDNPRFAGRVPDSGYFGFTARDRYIALSKVVKRKDRATVLQVSVEQQGWDRLSAEAFQAQLDWKYPDFKLTLRRGDVIENVAIYKGKRRHGSEAGYFYDGENIIDRDYGFMYGSIPFVVFDEFPPDYWVVRVIHPGEKEGKPRQYVIKTDMNIDNRYVPDRKEVGLNWPFAESGFRVDEGKVLEALGSDKEITFRDVKYFIRVDGRSMDTAGSPISQPMVGAYSYSRDPNTVIVY